MATKKPRIAITLEPQRYDLLKRLATLQGGSMAGLVGELMEVTFPVLERVCVALEAAKQASESSIEGMRIAADRAMAELQPMMDASMDQLDMFVSDYQKAVSDASAAVTESLSPRVVTRGSGIKKVILEGQVKTSKKPVTARVTAIRGGKK